MKNYLLILTLFLFASCAKEIIEPLTPKPVQGLFLNEQDEVVYRDVDTSSIETTVSGSVVTEDYIAPANAKFGVIDSSDLTVTKVVYPLGGVLIICRTTIKNQPVTVLLRKDHSIYPIYCLSKSLSKNCRDTYYGNVMVYTNNFTYQYSDYYKNYIHPYRSEILGYYVTESTTNLFAYNNLSLIYGATYEVWFAYCDSVGKPIGEYIKWGTVTIK